MSALSNIGYIAKASKHPCHFNSGGQMEFTIVVETALTAAIPTLLSLNQFSCTDIVKLKAGISWKCGRALRALLKQTQGPETIDGAKFWYNVTGAAIVERLLWYWFVADLATEYVANWESLMYEEAGCDQPYAGTLYSNVAHHAYPTNTDDQYVVPQDIVANECAGIGPDGVFVEAGCSVSVGMQANFNLCAGYSKGSNPQVQLVQRSTGDVFYASGIWMADGSNGNGLIVQADHIPGNNFGETYQLVVKTGGPSDGCSQVTSGSVVVTTYGQAVNFRPVGCRPKQT